MNPEPWWYRWRWAILVAMSIVMAKFTIHLVGYETAALAFEMLIASLLWIRWSK